tara:strand:- start:433 stop:603 length:171 start_codon:yes stop_codon:yes gene_type:complete
MKLITFLTGAFFSILSVLGLLFKIQHWPGATIGIVLGLGGFALIFIPLFTIYQYRK